MRYTREEGCRAWLTYGLMTANKLQAVLDAFDGDAQCVYDAFVRTGGQCLEKLTKPEQRAQLLQRAAPEQMHDMMVTMHRLDMHIVSRADVLYPDALRDLSDAPALLFYRGNLDCLSRRCLTMIGTRTPSIQAEDATVRIARELSEHGVTIVSGFAYGIDSAAHLGCLDGGSPTASVLACGLDVDYPVENIELREQIVEAGGVLLSEYPPGMRASPIVFPVRNRILAGLSRAVVMMEGKIRSGSMNTVQHALDQGKDVFAYPSAAGGELAEGTHQLLREGAIYFTTAQDILEDMQWDSGDCRPPTLEEQSALPEVSGNQRAVLTLLSRGEMSFDQLISASGLSPSTLSGTLTMLQIQGLIRALPGKTYCRTSS